MISPNNRIAVIGSGIAGLSAAYRLKSHAQLTLFEANDYFGGHTHTVDITLDTPRGPVTHGVDTGFLVFNERTYPKLIALFNVLGIASSRSDMSFSVQIPKPGHDPLEWNGRNVAGLFAQKRNLLNPKFWGMLKDILRFNHLCTHIAKSQNEHALRQPLSLFLDQNKFGEAFRDWYFLPMMGSIWSCPSAQMLEFPVATMIRFCYNHGLIQVLNRPEWQSVLGGARAYVDAIVTQIPDRRLRSPVERIRRHKEGVELLTQNGRELFDEVIIATHSDQALAMLEDPSPDEQHILGAIPYQDNFAVLHTDAAQLPQSRQAWAAWNYERALDGEQESARVCLHYLLNRLQVLPFDTPVIVSLNPIRKIDERKILASFHYAHPIFDLKAMDAQRQLKRIQGGRHTWFAGAWTGYGFHEDGLSSGFAVADALEAKLSASRSPEAA